MWSFSEEISYSKLFDEKIVLNIEYQHAAASNHNGEKWRIQTHGYLISRCPVIMAVLGWAEKSEEPVAQQALEHQARTKNWPDIIDYCKFNGACGAS